MSIHVIKVPDLGEGIAEVELVAWHVAPGDEVVEDQPLADVMTDKANVEIPSPVTGRVVSLGGKSGQVMAVGADLIQIDTGGAGGQTPAQAGGPVSAGTRGSAAPDSSISPGTQAAAETQAAPQALQTPDVPNVPHAAEAPDAAEESNTSTQDGGQAQSAMHEPSTSVQPQTQPGEQPESPTLADQGPALASPAVRRHARELGIDLRTVRGTGPGGRVLHPDLDAFAARAAGDKPSDSQPRHESLVMAQSPGAQPSAARPDAARPDAARPSHTRPGAVLADEGGAGVKAIPLTGLRRRIAQRMQDSLRIPHFTYVEEVDVTDAERLRAELNGRFAAERGHLTLLALIVRAVAMAVRDFPQMSARFDDEAGVITQFDALHLGIATHTPAGLVVPVVRDVQAKSVWSTAAEIASVAEAARQGKATREQLSGSTLTITSLGALGGIVSTPVINLPEVAIIGVNRIVERPAFRDGVVVPRKMMNLSSSFDHRVIDGMPAAQFVQEIRRLLECPALLFIE